MTVLWGISFDATPISGVVVEFVKTARHLKRRGYRVHLDLGYDVKADKNAFFRPYSDEAALLPGWITLDRVSGIDRVPYYDREFVAEVLREHVPGTGGPDGKGAHLLPRIEAVAEALSERIVETWEQRGVTFVMVENGTLPENIAYTRALHTAIERYGRRHRLGPYVMWRDHDLMWQSEPGTGKYGAFPYPTTVPPADSPYIRYIALHEEARRRTLEWVPDLTNIAVLPNTFTHGPAADQAAQRAAFRAHFGIPRTAPLIARSTRIIPQKRIDRDIHLLARLTPRLGERPPETSPWLFIAGDTAEAPDETARLTRLAGTLGVAGRVVFGGRLAPHEAGVAPARGAGFSVRDLLAAADLASFLTSYDYESYGNPVGEAIASRVPYLTTRYELYDTVYGNKGFRAPVMELPDGTSSTSSTSGTSSTDGTSGTDGTGGTHAADASDDGDLPAPPFVDSVAELILDERKREEMADFNHRLGTHHFGEDRAGELLAELFPDAAPMGARTRMSVVLPVYNEAANLPAVLDSLHRQQGPDGGPLDKTLYEVVLVDNNSTDDTVAVAREFAAAHPELALHIVPEPEQGVSSARKTGMDFASRRSLRRKPPAAGEAAAGERFYLVSADADCRVDPRWLWELLTAMDAGKAAIGVCDYYYNAGHFTGRPRLWDAIQRTLRCRAVTFSLFGGFPDGKGFAVDRDAYEKVGGIEISYQLQNGRFVNHLSDDWDFGILVRGSGEDITYAPRSRVEINPRRVNHAIEEVITGRAYGSGGIIVMRDIRPAEAAGPEPEPGEPGEYPDLTEEEALQAWEFSIKDFTPKNTILPVLLTPSLLDDDAVVAFFGPSLAERLGRRIAEITEEMRVVDFTPIHSYKTPSYRLYFEFRDEIFERLRATVGEDIGYPPPLPECFDDVPPERFREFVKYYCEDRESGEAHDYFGNGGVF